MGAVVIAFLIASLLFKVAYLFYEHKHKDD